MELKKALPILDRFITWATPLRITLLASVILVLIGSFTVFEKRDVITQDIVAHQPVIAPPKDAKVELSSEIKQQIVSLVARSGNISAITVFSANLRLNRRTALFYYSADPVLQLKMVNHFNEHENIFPLFTGQDKSNTQVVSAINGEFSCHKFADTIIAVRMPAAAADMPLVCQISLPPYYGDFNGYIVFGIKRILNQAELDDLQNEAVRLSTEIYLKVFLSTIK